MWDTPFAESMLRQGRHIIIHCPSSTLADELMGVLERNGVTWGLYEKPTNNTRWSAHEEETCYWIRGHDLSFGSRGHAENDPYGEYENYIRCTFLGAESPDFDAATDAELRALFGV